MVEQFVCFLGQVVFCCQIEMNTQLLIAETFLFCMVHSLLVSTIKGLGCINLKVGHICC
jgi:hypothetical protein